MSPRAPADVLRQLADRYALLAQCLGPRLISVVLFGSVARGDAHASSDIDLFIVATDLRRGQFARKALLSAADAALEQDLSAAAEVGVETRLARIVRTPQEAARIIPLYLDMTEDAALLYDRDGFFAGVLDRLRTSLRRLGARRVRRGRYWYWDLKPDFSAATSSSYDCGRDGPQRRHAPSARLPPAQAPIQATAMSVLVKSCPTDSSGCSASFAVA